ncbi:MAG TPA: pyridoxal phosphate-dependent aminotransferase [Chloroflexota bacterium]|nr:pyridoxal phosphate-dependent aminotransferase [Chloroflexota bacterium]
MEFAARMSRLGTETAFEVLARARDLERQGRDIIHLEIGEPDFDTPGNIVDAAVRALREGYTHYNPSAGVDELRVAIAEDQNRRKGLNASPDNVVVTAGGKPIMFYVMLALLEAGDEVIYPNPGFPIYESMINFLNARAIPIGFNEVGGRLSWDVDTALERIGPRTKMIVINSPSNPVGANIGRPDLERVAEAVRGRNILVLSDEIYSRMLYDDDFCSIASLEGMAEKTCVLDGFSKTYAMTGWRLGYGVMPLWLAPQVTRLVTNSTSCTATFVQMAGVEALTGPQQSVTSMVNEFRRRRDLVIPGLNDTSGVTCAVPQGAFYAFPNIARTGLSSREAADLLLYEAGVAVLAGTSFGSNGEGYLRLSYANSYENLERALGRMKEVLEHAALSTTQT